MKREACGSSAVFAVWYTGSEPADFPWPAGSARSFRGSGWRSPDPSTFRYRCDTEAILADALLKEIVDLEKALQRRLEEVQCESDADLEKVRRELATARTARLTSHNVCYPQ